ncbi:hypothetical protein LguiA_017425 [Lonicera macranthoides]
MESGKSSHFVLVHGAGHGAWCWYRVSTMLRSVGCRVSAVDLAGSGIHPNRADEGCSISVYCEPLMKLMADLPAEDRVVLVGHSLGGVPLTVAMERFPHKIAAAVFVTAVMPGPDFNLLTITQKHPRGKDYFMDSQLIFNEGLDERPNAILFGLKFMSSKLYQLSPPEDLTLGMLLVRPFPFFDWAKTSIETLTQENYGSVRRVFVVSEEDNVILEEKQRWMIENNLPNDVKVISGSDHMVMFSKPRELFSCLMEIAEQSC